LRISPSTLLGDYGRISFSAIQGANLQDKEAVSDMQYVMAQQYYSPIYRDRFNANIVLLQGMFPEIESDDYHLLRNPEIVARAYMIVDKQRLIGPLLEQWEKGLATWSELRDELGFLCSDPDAIIEEWKEDRRRLGLPEHPTSGGSGVQSDDDDNASDADDDDEDEDEED